MSYSFFFSLGDEYRPVALRKIVLGYPYTEKQSDFKFDLALNYKLSNIIQTYSENKPTLVVSVFPSWLGYIIDQRNMQVYCWACFQLVDGVTTLHRKHVMLQFHLKNLSTTCQIYYYSHFLRIIHKTSHQTRKNSTRNHLLYIFSALLFCAFLTALIGSQECTMK